MATKPKTAVSKTKPAASSVADASKPEPAAIPAPGGLSQGFAKEVNSPFADGYSIDGEERALAEFLSGPMSETDPLYERYIELEDRKDRLERMQVEFEGRKGANMVVSRDEARGLDDLGTLVDEEVDQMTIHTKEAYRMFMGRMREP
jgi:hypothetical protein